MRRLYLLLSLLALAAAPARAEDPAKNAEATTPGVPSYPFAADGSPSDTIHIRPGDTLSGIAKSLGVPVARLVEMNGIADPSRIRAGDSLFIPFNSRIPPERRDPADPPANTDDSAFLFAESIGADALHYYEGGPPWARVEDMTLVFAEHRVRIDCYRNGADYRAKTNATLRRDHVCTDEEWRAVLLRLNTAHFENWEPVYPSPVRDGTSWMVDFLAGTNVVRSFRGANNWPFHFEQFFEVKKFAMRLPASLGTRSPAAEESHAENAESAEAPSQTPNPAADSVRAAFDAAWRRLDLPAFDDTAFAAFLYREVALVRPSGNLVLAPMGVAESLGFLAAGADLETAEALSNALCMQSVDARAPSHGPGDEAAVLFLRDRFPTADEIAATFRLHRERRAAVGAGGATALETSLSLWLPPGRSPSRAFAARATRDFGASVRNVPMDETGRAEVNAFVSAATHGRVPAALAEPPAPGTAALLVHVAWLKAAWADAFDPSLSFDGAFHAPDGDVPARFLRRTGLYALEHDDCHGCSALVLPMRGGEIEAVAILPDEGVPLADIEKDFDPTFVDGPFHPVTAATTVVLPKFSLETRHGDLLGPALRARQTDPVVLPPSSDFSALAGGDTAEVPPISQTAGLAIDEEGAEAWSVTVGPVPACAEPPPPPRRFVADRPFLFLVRDARLGTVFFIARVAAPVTRSPDAEETHAENAETSTLATPADPVKECFWHVEDDSYEWHPLSTNDSARVAALLADFEKWAPDPAYGPGIGVCEARNLLRIVSGSGVTNEYSFQMAACENNSFGNCVRRPSGPVRLVPDSVRREFVGLRQKWNREIEEAMTDRFLDASSIVRYERFSREDGDGETHAVPKAEGDEILALLANWKTFEELRPKPRQPGEPCITVQIRHPDLVLSCFRADGSSKSVRFFRIIDGSTKRTRLYIELPDVRWPRRVPDEPACAILAKLDAWSAADRAAFLAVPLPRTYVFRSTFWDGGTLSGVAKLFYGDGNKWRVVWEANKEAVPNPDYVLSGTPLVIPALPSP